MRTQAFGLQRPHSMQSELDEVVIAADPAAPSSLAECMSASGCSLFALQPATTQDHNRSEVRLLGCYHLATVSLSFMQLTLQLVLLRLPLLQNACQLLAALCSLCNLQQRKITTDEKSGRWDATTSIPPV